MTRGIDLWDVQGNIVRAYGRFGYPHARHMFFHLPDHKSGQVFLAFLLPLVTSGVTWGVTAQDIETNRPQVTMNIGFTWRGLQAMQLPTQALGEMPVEFVDGMARRASILSDNGASDPANWDPIWRASNGDPSRAVHIWVALNARMDPVTGAPVPQLEQFCGLVRQFAKDFGVVMLAGHGDEATDVQQAGLNIVPDGNGAAAILPYEHFGFADGISDPVFKGQVDGEIDASVIVGRGRYRPNRGWSLLETGEFILGHVDESQEIPRASHPPELTRNGSFAVFRKLEQDVAAFEAYVAEQAARWVARGGIGQEEAVATVKAKLMGRWPNGAPLVTVPTYADMLRFAEAWKDIPALLARSGRRSAAEQARIVAWRGAINGFTYSGDREGISCPMGAHVRRGNPRDMLDPMGKSSREGRLTGSALTNRRRILRRGIPYGPFGEAEGARGLLFIAICADLRRQFEFVQQQWMNHGMDMGTGNLGCPFVGNRAHADPEGPGFVIAGDAAGGAPFVMAAMPDFVRTKGGDYFFLPSLTALRTMADGAFDAT